MIFLSPAFKNDYLIFFISFEEYPMKAGLIENWSDIEDIWEYMLYSELGIEEGSNPILVTEVANTPRKNREKMAEVRFHWMCVCNARTMFLCLLIP